MKSHTDEELKKIAKDILDEKIFTDRHIRDKNLISSIFMVVHFLGAIPKDSTAHKAAEIEDDYQDIMNNLGMLYEYYDKANHMSINSYPTFFSVRMLNKEDTVKVWEYYDKIKTAVDKALESVV